MKPFRTPRHNQGYVLPLTIGLGLAVLILGLTAALVVQTDRTVSQQRRQRADSLAVAEGAADRIMTQLSSRNNTILMGRNYDPINPRTGRAYLGADGSSNSGDETTTTLDEWTNFIPNNTSCFQMAGVGQPNLPLTGTIGSATYTVKAYRYDPEQQIGTLLVEGTHNGQSTTIEMKLSVTPDWQNFPTVLGIQNNPNNSVPVGTVALRGRQLSGNANVYFNASGGADPSLTGYADPGAADRSSYLNTIWASPNLDGGRPNDPVPGRIAACGLDPWPGDPIQPTGTVIIDSSTTLTGAPGQLTRYWVDKLNLNGTETLTVDTTAGPVEIRIKGDPTNWSNIDFTVFELNDDAKVLNVRTDGKPPRLGDLRIIFNGHYPLAMYGRSCIQNALLWLPVDEFWLMTSGPGCPGGRNSNFEGVVWAEAILSSKNSPTNRDLAYLGNGGRPYDTTITPNATSGIFVPDDLSSLTDLLHDLDWPTRYRFQRIIEWRQVRQ
jgi:hypothetical protein